MSRNPDKKVTVYIDEKGVLRARIKSLGTGTIIPVTPRYLNMKEYSKYADTIARKATKLIENAVKSYNGCFIVNLSLIYTDLRNY